MTDRRRISIRIPEPELAAVQAQAREEKSTVSAVIRRACDVYISRYKQYREFMAAGPIDSK